MEIVLTTKQRVLAHRDQQVAAAFRELRRENPDASAAAIVRTLVAAGRFKLSEPGMKRVLYGTGTLPENRKNA